jgi:hypothetical protein
LSSCCCCHRRYRRPCCRCVIVAVVVVAVIVADVVAIVITFVVATIVVIIHCCHLHLVVIVLSIIIVSVRVISVICATPFPLVASLPPACGDDEQNFIVVVIVVVCLSSIPAGCHFSLSSVVIDFCRRCRHCLRPHQGPHTAEMVTAANATSRSVVVVLFGPIAAVWAAVEGMTLLPSNGSGLGRGSCFASWYNFYVFLP